MGLTNLKIIIQFCRRVEEARKVIKAIAQHGLKRGEGGLQIFMMCEIPNNVILIDQIAQLFDGFSIGSNDLTQLTLGVDRHSSLPLISTSVTRHAADAVNGRSGRKAQPPPCEHLRRGAGELPGDREVEVPG
jgi:phosphoenolpyruvate synthase/pyruvate phosphate dikinase